MNTGNSSNNGSSSSQSGFWDEFYLGGELDLLRLYLDTMEGFFDSQIQAHLKQLEDLKPGYSLAEQGVAPHELEFIDICADMLRKSFFVAIYAFAESRLMKECRAQKQKRDDILLSISDIRGKGIDQAKTYLVKVLGHSFPFGTDAGWREIQNYRRLRNCIVHNESTLETLDQRDREHLKRYVDSKRTMHLYGDEIRFDKGFCEEALHTIGKFLWALLFQEYAQDQGTPDGDVS